MLNELKAGTEKPLRFAVAGLRHGHGHGAVIKARKDCELVAICDCNEDVLHKECAKLSVDPSLAYPDFDEMLASVRPDAVVISTPVHLHAPMAISALDMGIHVLLEKPMTDDVASAYALDRAVKRSGKVLQVGFEFRSSPLIQKAMEIIDSGELGQVVVVWSNMFRGPARTAANGWRGKHGLFFDCMIHEIDGLMHFAGADFERVAAYGAPQGVKGLKSADQAPNTVTASIEFENAIRGSLAFSDLSATYDASHFGIVGDRGRIDGEMWEPYGAGSLKLYTHGGLYRTKIDIDGNKTSRGHLGFREQYNFFIDSIRNGAPNVSDVENGLRLQRIMAALELSMCEGRSVYRQEVDHPSLESAEDPVTVKQ